MNSQLQRFNRMIRPQGRIFYGWWIVLASGGIQLLSSMLWMQSYGAYMVLLQAEFHWSKTLVSGAFAMTRVESGILGPLQGWLVDRFGPRAMLRIGIVMFGSGFMALSQINTIITFYLAFAMIAVGSSLGGFATVMVAIVSWFNKNRAKAISVSQMGFSAGGLSVPLVIVALELYGWRVTAFSSGVLVLLLGLPLAQIVRHRPEPYGEVQDGYTAFGNNGDQSSEPVDPERDYTAREAMRTRAFWLLSVGHASALLTVSAIMVHLVPHLTEGLGYTLTQAGGVVALMTACQMCGQLLGGYMGDLLEKRFICIACMLGHATGLLLLAYASSLSMVISFALMHGLAWGMRGPLVVALRADYFGPSSFGTIMGFSSLIVMFGMSSGALIAGLMADISGNYQSGFTLLAVAAFLGSFCFLLALPPRRLVSATTSIK